MNGKDSLKKNLFYNSLYQITIVIAPLITSPILSRTLGANAIGEYNYAASVANYFVIFAMLGMKTYGCRYIASLDDDKSLRSIEFWNLYGLQILLTLICSCAYVLYLIFFCNQNQLIAFTQVMVVISTGFDVSWFFAGIEKFKIVSLRSLFVKLLNIVIIICFVRKPDDLLLYAFLIAAGTLCSQFLFIPMLKNEVCFCRPSFSDMKEHMMPNMILFLPTLILSVKTLNRIFLGNVNMTELGYFTNAENLCSIPNSFVTGIGTVFLSRMTNLLHTSDDTQYKNLMTKAFYFSVIAGSAITFGIFAVCDCFVPWFWGDDFVAAVPAVKIISLSLIFTCWAEVIKTEYFLPQNKEKLYIISLIISHGSGLLISYTLTMKNGLIGTCIAVLWNEILNCIVHTIFAWKQINCKKHLINNLPFILFGIVMALVIMQINAGTNFLTLVVRFVIGGLIYCALSIVYLWFKDREVLFSFIRLIPIGRK